MKIFNKNNISHLITAIIGFLFAYPVVCRWFNFLQKTLSEKVIALISAWILCAFITWLLNRMFQFTKKTSGSVRNIRIGGSALAGSLILLWVFHWQPPAFPSNFQVELSPTGNVQLIQVKFGGKAIALDQFFAPGGWRLTKDGLEHNSSATEIVTFTGTAPAPLELVFATGPEEGSVVINLNGTTSRLNLNTPLPDSAFYRPFPASLGSPTIMWIFWVGLLALSEWLLLAGILYFFFSRWASGTTAFILPLVFLLPYITTFAGHNVTIGNDFGPFYYVYKTYLLDFLANGHYPLWSPSEAAGYPLFSNPLAQTFYPPNILLTLAYWINQGYTRLDHQIFTVLAVSWFSLGLYLWLRSLQVEKRFALFAALTMALSYKMTELLRFPNAMHEAAWFPWILLSLTGLFKSANNKSSLCWSAALFASLICFFTAGYPYFIYYLPFLAAPYLIFMVIPRVRSILFSIEKPNWIRFLSSAFTVTLLAVLVCAPYLYQMGRTISQTAGRSGGDFEHATMYPFNFQDAFEALVYPPASFFEGWFYFGALALLLIILYLARPNNGIHYSEKPVLSRRGSWAIKAALLAWLAFINYLSLGEQSILFLLFYQILPGFSALRSWGRINIALLPGLALLFAYALADFENRLVTAEKSSRHSQTWAWIAILIVTFGSLIYQMAAINSGLIDQGWNTFLIPRNAYLIQTIANTQAMDIQPDFALLSFWFKLAFCIFTVMAAILTGMMILKFKLRLGSPAHWLMFLGLGVFSAANLWFGSAWMWNNGFHPEEDREPGNYQRMLSISLTTPRKNEDSTLTLSPSFSVGSPPKWHYSRYQEFYSRAAVENTARDELLGVTDGRRFFFSTSINYPNVTDFLKDTHQFEFKPVVHDYTGDSLLLEVNVPQAGYFSFIDNWDEDWRATVDDKPVEIERLFGVFKSIPLEPGKHEVSMAYCPRFFEWTNNGCTNKRP